MRKYASKKSDSRPTAAQTAAKEVAANPGMPMSAMRSMLMDKAMADRSHRIDLPAAMREKMERSFGMNFDKVNLYESESVADAGADAIAQGGAIAFAPGEANFNNLTGQSLLGHELSHIAAQARGEVTGSGFLDNGALEARADREGALAAQGEQVYSGSVTDAPSFSAAAPMQAHKNGKKDEQKSEDKSESFDMLNGTLEEPDEPMQYKDSILDALKDENEEDDDFWDDARDVSGNSNIKNSSELNSTADDTVLNDSGKELSPEEMKAKTIIRGNPNKVPYGKIDPDSTQMQEFIGIFQKEAAKRAQEERAKLLKKKQQKELVEKLKQQEKLEQYRRLGITPEQMKEYKKMFKQVPLKKK